MLSTQPNDSSVELFIHWSKRQHGHSSSWAPTSWCLCRDEGGGGKGAQALGILGRRRHSHEQGVWVEGPRFSRFQSIVSTTRSALSRGAGARTTVGRGDSEETAHRR